MPGAPRNLRIDDLTKTSVTLSWQAPDSDGGGELTGYYIEKRSNYSTRWVPLNRAPVTIPTYTVRDITEGEECEYRVAAANDAGVGQPSETTGIVTARDLVTKPGPPTALTAELDASGRVAELRWKKPTHDGQSPIINYVVEMRSKKSPRWKVNNFLLSFLFFSLPLHRPPPPLAAGAILTEITESYTYHRGEFFKVIVLLQTLNINRKVKTTNYTVEDLEPDVEYEFRVSAENNIGTSEPTVSNLLKYGQSCSRHDLHRILTALFIKSVSTVGEPVPKRTQLLREMSRRRSSVP